MVGSSRHLGFVQTVAALAFAGGFGACHDPHEVPDAVELDAADASFGKPVTIAFGQPGPRALALDATGVYWTTQGGTVAAVTKPNPGGDRNLATSQPDPMDIAVQSGRVYWTNLGGFRGSVVMASSPDGSNTSSAMDTGSYTGSGRIAVDGSAMWITTSSSVCRVPSIGTPSCGLWAGNYKAIASDGLTVYLATTDMILAATIGSAPTGFAAPVNLPLDLAVDDDFVYWLAADGTLSKLDKTMAGQAPTTLAKGQAGLGRMALDDTSVYFTAAGSSAGLGRVARVPKAGGPVVDLATNLAQPFGIAVDATGIYWTNAGDGTVMMTPRN